MSATMLLMYWRVLLSSPVVGFSSPEEKCLFSYALTASTMEGFFSLVSVFRMQSKLTLIEGPHQPQPLVEGPLADKLGYSDLNFGRTMVMAWWCIGPIGFLINHSANPC
jgi:hypothetical protein